MIATCHSAASAESTDCPICFETLANKRILTLHPCMHRFHHTCIVRWFETRENFAIDPRCSLCRTVSDGRVDEQGRRIAVTFPMEEKNQEVDIEEVDLKDLVRLWITISGLIKGLDEDRERALQNEKSGEYVVDIVEEISKLTNRQDATELLFVTIVINSDDLIKSLQAEVSRRKTALGKEINEGVQTRTLTRKKRALEKDLAAAKKAFKDEVNATAKDAQDTFKELCAAELAAAAAAKTPGPSTAAPAKRRMRVEEEAEEGMQQKRRR